MLESVLMFQPQRSSDGVCPCSGAVFRNDAKRARMPDLNEVPCVLMTWAPYLRDRLNIPTSPFCLGCILELAGDGCSLRGGIPGIQR